VFNKLGSIRFNLEIPFDDEVNIDYSKLITSRCKASFSRTLLRVALRVQDNASETRRVTDSPRKSEPLHASASETQRTITLSQRSVYLRGNNA